MFAQQLEAAPTYTLLGNKFHIWPAGFYEVNIVFVHIHLHQ